MHYQNYVLCFAQTNTDKILLIEKQRPEWQKGCFNLIGGKIEVGEHPIDAAKREFLEETGINVDISKIERVGQIDCSNASVVCCFSMIVDEKEINDSFPKISDGEKVFWESWDTVKEDIRLISNLKIIIPFFKAGIKNWSLFQENENKNVYRLDVRSGSMFFVS